MNILSHLHSPPRRRSLLSGTSLPNMSWCNTWSRLHCNVARPVQRGVSGSPAQKVLEDVLNMTSTMGKLGKMEIGIWYELQSEMCRRISRTIDKAYGILWVCLNLKLGYIPQLQCVLHFFCGKKTWTIQVWGILLSDKPQEMWQVTAKESVVRKSKNTMPSCELAICGDYPWVSKNRNCPEATIVLPSPKTHLWDVSFPSGTVIYKFTRNPTEQW